MEILEQVKKFLLSVKEAQSSIEWEHLILLLFAWWSDLLSRGTVRKKTTAECVTLKGEVSKVSWDKPCTLWPLQKPAVKPEKRELKSPLLTKATRERGMEGRAASGLFLKPLSTCLPAYAHGPCQKGTDLKAGQSSTPIDETRVSENPLKAESSR